MRKGERFGWTMNCIESWDIWITFHSMILQESFSASYFKYVKHIPSSTFTPTTKPTLYSCSTYLPSPPTARLPACSAFYRFLSFRWCSVVVMVVALLVARTRCAWKISKITKSIYNFGISLIEYQHRVCHTAEVHYIGFRIVLAWQMYACQIDTVKYIHTLHTHTLCMRWSTRCDWI